MGFNYGSHFRQGCLSAGHLLHVFVGETPVPKQGSQHRETHAVLWQRRFQGSEHQSQHRTKRCQGRRNRARWDAQDHLSIRQNMDDAHLPKPRLQKIRNPDTSGSWDEMGGSGSARLRKEPEGCAQSRRRSSSSHFLQHKWNGFYFGSGRLK